MRFVLLQNTDIKVSRLSFGTASLHHLQFSMNRQRLLTSAIEAGFSHFDTSPYYGYGLAEAELGKLQKTSGCMEITIATKVGLYAPHETTNGASVICHKMLGRIIPKASRSVVDWSIARATISINKSLGRLRRSWVDILFLHEPIISLLKTDEWLTWLEKLRAEGKIRAWGVAGEPEHLASFLEHGSPVAKVVQVRDSLEKGEADLITRYGRKPQFTYGYFRANRTVNQQVPAEQILGMALKRNDTGSIVVATRKRSRVRVLASMAES